MYEIESVGAGESKGTRPDQKRSRAGIVAALIALVVLLPSVAGAQGQAPPTGEPDNGGACVKSFDRAQVLRREGKLVAARRELVACALPACLDVIERKCSEWLDEVDKILPTVAIVVEGTDNPFNVFVDDEPFDAAMLGHATATDPGPHRIRVELAGRPPVEKHIVVAEGEHNRVVRIELARTATPTSANPPPANPPPANPPPANPPPSKAPEPPTPSSDRESSALSPLVWIGFGVAAAGALVGGITGGLALSKGSEIADACPDDQCTEDQRDTYDSGLIMAHVSTASFAVAGAGLVVGIVGLLLPTGDEQQADQSGWQLEPLVGPAAIGLRGRF